MRNKGFIIEDALICLLITVIICSLCLMSLNTVINYEDGKKMFIENNNSEYIEIFSSLSECEKCQIEEKEDSSN